jgi:membrane protease YdiL (CAAX protease family)
MDYLPSAFFGLFLIYTACSKAEIGWGDIGLRIPNSFAVWKKAIGLSILAFMMALPLVYFCQILNALVWSSYDLMAPLMLRIYEGGDMLPFAFISVGVAAVFEELLFRGLLFSSLRARTNLERTNWLQAIAFALFHFNPTSFLPLLALGMVIGRVRETTTSVLPCIIVHALWNLTVCLVTYYQLGA